MIDTKGSEIRSGSVRLLVWLLAPVVLGCALIFTRTTIEMGSAWVALAVVVVPVVVVVAITTTDVARRWARDRGARVDGRMLHQLHRQLVRTRAARTFGVTLAIATGWLLQARYNALLDDFSWYMDVWNPHLNGLWIIGLGYIVASAWAEVTKPRDRDDARPGVAVLAPRRLADHLDPTIRVAVVVAAGLVTAAALIWLLVPGEPQVGGPGTDVQSLVPAGLAAVVAVVAMAVAAAICRRRQVAHDEAALIYDELTRTAAVNALAGAAIAMLGSAALDLVSQATTADRVTGWIAAPFLIASLLGLGLWIGSGTSLVFRTRRIDALRSDP